MKAIDKFLANWKKQATEFYIEMAAKNVRLAAELAEAKTAAGIKFFSYKEARTMRGEDTFRADSAVCGSNTTPTYNREQFEQAFPALYEAFVAQRKFFSAMGKGGMIVLENMANHDKQYADRARIRKVCKENGYKLPEFKTAAKFLDEVLTKEVESKRAKLIARVEKKTGKITDASALRVASNAELNGKVIGEKGEAYVETITAGGYNIQCLHYRVLVK